MRSNSESNLDRVLDIPADGNSFLNTLSPKKSTFAHIGLIFEKLRKILLSRGILDIRELFDGKT